MALTPRLELRQSQSLVMTPQLQQAIKLLQFSNLELAEYVEQELEKNPMLERDEEDHCTRDAGPSESAEPPPRGTTELTCIHCIHCMHCISLSSNPTAS